MTRSGYFIAVILMVTLSFTSVNAILKCWRCNTDTFNSEFCKDPFDVDRSYDVSRIFSLVNCTYPTNYIDLNFQQKRPACKKLVTETYGKTVISRSCVWVDVTEPNDKCYYDNYPSYVKVKYCETCSTDGCNGANGMIPIASIILIPALLAKILMI